MTPKSPVHTAASHPPAWTCEALLALRYTPAKAARLVQSRCDGAAHAAMGAAGEVWLRPAQPFAFAAPPVPAVRERDGVFTGLPVTDGNGPLGRSDWEATLRQGDTLYVHVPSDQAGGFAEWLLATGVHLPACAIAPWSNEASGTHRLWLVAAARLVLPPHVRVVVRHDLLGIRVAQVALGFGADVLEGPVLADRHLPLAGVSRPDETTRDGLEGLVRQVGKVPRWTAPTPSASASGPSPAHAGAPLHAPTSAAAATSP